MCLDWMRRALRSFAMKVMEGFIHTRGYVAIMLGAADWTVIGYAVRLCVQTNCQETLLPWRKSRHYVRSTQRERELHMVRVWCVLLNQQKGKEDRE